MDRGNGSRYRLIKKSIFIDVLRESSRGCGIEYEGMRDLERWNNEFVT